MNLAEIKQKNDERVLARVISLKTEIETCLRNKKHECADRFVDNNILKTMPIFLEHFRHLENEIARYIPQNIHIEKYSWVRNPFEADVMAVENHTAGLQEELFELQGDRVLKERFAAMSLTKFWAELSGKSILSN